MLRQSLCVIIANTIHASKVTGWIATYISSGAFLGLQWHWPFSFHSGPNDERAFHRLFGGFA
jgi:hypothetical protein